MKLHHLTLRAFGPFAQSVSIDFDTLGAAGLFLINGPTGAGKSSLLDAVCFALYGNVPGVREVKTLRSHHADADAETSVELEWSVRGQRFRISRSPEYQRPKKRGTGFTTQPPKVTLTELVGGSWVDRGSSRADEVGRIVGEVLGLTLEQFKTVVLLPQGDFARFLRANSNERQEMLQKLFDAQRFTDMTAWLAGQRREASEAVERARAGLREQLLLVEHEASRFVDQAEAPDGPLALVGLSVDATHAGVPDGVDALVCRGDAKLADARATAESAGTAAARAETALSQAQARAKTREKGEKAQQRQVELEAEVAAVEADRDAVAAARRAALVLPRLSAQEQRAARAEECHGAVERARAGVPGPLASRVEGSDADGDLASLVDELRELAEAVGRVSDAARSARTAQRHADETASKVDATKHQREKAEHAAARAAGALAEGRAQVEKLAPLAAGEPEWKRRVTELQGVGKRSRAVGEQRDRAAQARKRADEAAGRVKDATAALGELHARRAKNLAAELAEQLQPGEPCLVCGSREHPAPAVAEGDDAVTAEQISEAEAALEALRTSAGAAESAASGAEATLDTLAAELTTALAEAQLGGEGALTEALAAAQASLAEATAAAESLKLAQAALPGLEKRKLDADKAQGDATAALAGARAAASEAGEQAVRAARDASALWRELSASAALPLPSAGGDADAAPATGVLDSAANAVATAIRRVEALRDARRDNATAETELAAARAALDEALRAQSFADATAARAASRTPQQIAALEQRIADHVRASAEVATVLADADVRAALEGDPDDVTALGASASGARARATEASQAAGLVAEAVAQVAARRASVARAFDALAPAQARYELVREVADSAEGKGNNTLRMPLTTFVLAAQLEAVVTLANERLRVMTDGRYALQHTDALASHGRRSGLELEVVDAWSGKSRPTTSLSGGETFMASLALALGLGDAVRAAAGGIDLDTLFVDEGFGTLDEDALEQVMEVLDALREGGRSVGIISHVTDLRQRIPAQVRVSRLQEGSTLKVVTGVEEG